MRAGRTLLLIAALLLPSLPLASAQDGALAAAVAPAQTVVDAAARAVTRAISEAERDGTPDEAESIQASIQRYVAELSAAGSVSEQATYREATLAALPYAQRVANALEGLPAQVAELATSSARCARQVLTPAEEERLVVARLSTGAIGEELVALAAAPPQGVDARRLGAAGQQLVVWSATYEDLAGCATRDSDGSPRPRPQVLALSLRPTQAWRTAEVEAFGVTNAPGTVTLSSPGLGVQVEVPVTDGAFRHRFVVPLAASLGAAPLEASLGNLSANATLDVLLAPSRLTVEAPARVTPGEDATFVVRLSSPVRERTEAATVNVSSGAGEISIELTGGAAEWSWTAPSDEGTTTLTFQYAGDEIVAPAERLVEIRVAPPPTPAEDRPTPDDPQPRSQPPWVLLALLALAILAAGTWFALRRRGHMQAGKAAFGAGGAPALAAVDSLPAVVTASLKLETAFVAIVQVLRRLGLVPRSATPREMRPAFERLGVRDDEIVSTFERVRYGTEPERVPWTQRARAWYERAAARLREERP